MVTLIQNQINRELQRVKDLEREISYSEESVRGSDNLESFDGLNGLELVTDTEDRLISEKNSGSVSESVSDSVSVTGSRSQSGSSGLAGSSGSSGSSWSALFKSDYNIELEGRDTSDEVAVLLSGGVDSSVALKLLQLQGHRVRAFYLKIWLEDEVAHLNE